MTDDLNAELAKAKRIAKNLQSTTFIPDRKPNFAGCGGPAAEEYWEYFTPARIVSLLAAVEAALKAAQEFDAEDGYDAAAEPDLGHPVSRGDKIREVISRELTGKEESGDGR